MALLRRAAPLRLLLLVTLGLACEDQDCDRWDCGTCGAPCCTVHLEFGTMSADELSAKFINTVSSPTMPGNLQFKDVHCVGSTDPATAWTWDPEQNPSAQMFPVSAAEPASKASCVAVMSTSTSGDAFGGAVWTDQMNFVIVSEGGVTVMKAASFSSAQAPTLMCDWGQNCARSDTPRALATDPKQQRWGWV